MFLNRIDFRPDTSNGPAWVLDRQSIEKHLLFQAAREVFLKSTTAASARSRWVGRATFNLAFSL